MRSKVVVGVAMVLLGCAFVFAALAKSLTIKETIGSLEHVFGGASAPTMARALVIWEIALGAALIARLAPRATLAATLATLGAFIGWIAYLEAIDAPVGCGCGSAALEIFGGDGRIDALIRAGVMLLVTVVALRGVTLYRRGPRGARTMKEVA